METVEAIAANPQRLGKPLHNELSGRRSARYGSYRVLFQTDSSTRTVTISAIGHRSHVYRQR